MRCFPFGGRCAGVSPAFACRLFFGGSGGLWAPSVLVGAALELAASCGSSCRLGELSVLALRRLAFDGELVRLLELLLELLLMGLLLRLLALLVLPEASLCWPASRIHGSDTF